MAGRLKKVKCSYSDNGKRIVRVAGRLKNNINATTPTIRCQCLSSGMSARERGLFLIFFYYSQCITCSYLDVFLYIALFSNIESLLPRQTAFHRVAPPPPVSATGLAAGYIGSGRGTVEPAADITRC